MGRASKAGASVGHDPTPFNVDAGVHRDSSGNGSGKHRAHAWSGSSNGAGLASFLGWFSIGLGVAQVVAPGKVSRLIGATPSRRNRNFMRAFGLREIGNGVAILTNPLPKEWVGTRIAGDLLDIAALGGVLAVASDRRDKTLMATLAVAGVTALDIFCFEQLSEARQVEHVESVDGPGTHVRRSITVAQPVEVTYRFWRDFGNLPLFMGDLLSVEVITQTNSRWKAAEADDSVAEWTVGIVEDRENEVIAWRAVNGSKPYETGAVRFRAAPIAQATEVTLESWYDPPAGKIGKAVLKLFRESPGQRLADDLRRMKQVLETGSVVISDASAVRGAHAAQPASHEDRPPRGPIGAWAPPVIGDDRPEGRES